MFNSMITIVLLVLVVSVQGCSGGSEGGAGNAGTALNSSNFASFTVFHGAGGWRVEVGSDGSASAGYGSNPSDIARTKPSTIDFAKNCDALLKASEPHQPKDGTSSAARIDTISLNTKNGANVTRYMRSDTHITVPLLKDIIKASNNPRMQQLWDQTPLP